MYNYVVTAQKPTCVTHSAVGNFTDPNDRNLIVGYAGRQKGCPAIVPCLPVSKLLKTDWLGWRGFIIE